MTTILWLTLIVLAFCVGWHWTALILTVLFIVGFVLARVVD